MMTEPTLFDVDEPHTNRFSEPLLDKGEAAKRLNRAQKLSDLYREDAKQTSVDAAKSIAPKLKGRKLEILHALETYGPMMVWEICERIGREKPSVSPRMGWLVDNGFIEEVGEGLSNNGNKATIYRRKYGN